MSVFYIYICVQLPICMCSIATKYVFNACSELTMFKISFFKRPCLKSETFMLYIIFMGNSHEIKVKVLSQLVCNFKYCIYYQTLVSVKSFIESSKFRNLLSCKVSDTMEI